jgi:hypothetical protein
LSEGLGAANAFLGEDKHVALVAGAIGYTCMNCKKSSPAQNACPLPLTTTARMSRSEMSCRPAPSSP